MAISDARYPAKSGGRGRPFHTVECRLATNRPGADRVWVCVVCGHSWGRPAMQKKAYARVPCLVAAKRRGEDGGQCLLDSF